MMILSVVGGTVVFTGGVAAAANLSAAANIADDTADVSTNHNWTATVNSAGSDQFDQVQLDYRGTGADLGQLNKEDITVVYDDGSKEVLPVDSVLTNLGNNLTTITLDISTPRSLGSAGTTVEIRTTNKSITNPPSAGDYTATVAFFDSGTPQGSVDHTFSISSPGGGLPPAPYVNNTDATFDPTTETTVTVDYNATGAIASTDDIRVQLLNETGSLVTANGSLNSFEGTATLTVPAGTPSLSGDTEVEYQLIDTGGVPPVLRDSDTSWLNASSSSAPTITNLNLGKTNGNISFSFDSDQELGSSTDDIAVNVTTPGGANITFDGVFVFTGDTAAPFRYKTGDTNTQYSSEGTYTMTVVDAKDSDGNNGGTAGDGSGLTTQYTYEEGGGLPGAPHISVSDSNYDPNTDTTVPIEFNATGEIAQSDINISILNGGSPVQNITNFGNTEGTTSATFPAGALTGDVTLIYELQNNSLKTTNASDTATLSSSGGGGDSITGTVTDASDDSAIENAEITVFNSSTGQFAGMTTTDASGGYSVSVSSGKYDVFVDKSGYDQNSTFGLQVSGSTTQNFQLNQVTTGYLNGTVTDNDGNPLQNVNVEVYSFASKKTTTTDSNGDYSFELPEGSYVMFVDKSGYMLRYERGVGVVGDEETTRDFNLGTGAIIKGYVKNQSDVLQSNINVQADGPATRIQLSNKAGYYEMRVPAGNYSMTAFAGQGSGQVAQSSPDVTLSEGDKITQNITVAQTSLSNVSVSYLGGSGNPDMNNISASVRMDWGMVQASLRNDTAGQEDFEDFLELEGLGVAADDRFEINFTVDGYNPETLLWGAKNVTWSSTQVGQNQFNVSVQTETVTMQGISNAKGNSNLPVGPLQGQDPDEIAWPSGNQDVADIGWNRTTQFGVFDLSTVPTQELSAYEGITITTNAQAFSRPKIVENENGTEQLQFWVGGPNKTVDGNKHDGFYSASIPDAVLDDWGVSDPETELKALYKGKDRDFTVEDTGDGARIELDISYSDGRIELSADDSSTDDDDSDDDDSDDSNDDDSDDSDDDDSNNFVSGGSDTTDEEDQQDDQEEQDEEDDETESAESSVETAEEANERGARVTGSVQNAKAGESVDITVPDPQTGQDYELDSVSVVPGRDADFEIDIESGSDPLDETPEGDFESEGTEALGYVSVETDLDNADIERATFTYRLSEAKLDELDATPEDVALHRYDEETGKWVERDTEVVGREGGDVLLQTTADGFSEWAVAVKTPAFAVTDATVDTTTATTGETVTVQAAVTNVGGADGQFTAEFVVDGEVVDSMELTISANTSVPIQFTRAFDQPGEYTLRVNGADVGQVEVTADESEPTDTEDETDDSGDGDESDESDEDTPTETPTEAPEDPTEGPTATEDSDDGLGPGFGLVTALLAIVLVLFGRARYGRESDDDSRQ